MNSTEDSGERCSVADCEQTNILPFLCFNCKSMFCKNHFGTSQHGCKCVGDFFKDVNAQAGPSNNVCSIIGCNGVSIADFFCKMCNQCFCVTHRHHDCLGGILKGGKSKLKEPEPKTSKMKLQLAKEKADKKVETTLRKAEMDPETQSLANKIRMMKLKGKSVGDDKIRHDCRMYFAVHSPVFPDSNDDVFKPTSLFASKLWTVAKTVDEFSRRLKLANTNYRPSGPKLGLFKLTDGSLISNRMDLFLEDLVNSGIISNGDSLILEYIANDKWENNDEVCFLANMDNLIKYQSASIQ